MENKTNGNERTNETPYKIECSECGCFWWVADKNNFSCPNCELAQTLINESPISEEDKSEVSLELLAKGKYKTEVKNLCSDWIAKCPKCKRNTIFKRMENRTDSPIICSDCGFNKYKTEVKRK
jgi:predicted RNA-binding Zn-ribbon protein involved in translation (DUF1610 family)